MTIRQMELLVDVIGQGSVTEAAKLGHVTPGAVTLQLQSLAAELRTELFIRAGKHLQPTPGALRLAAHAREVIRKVREIEREFLNDPQHDSRPFHFATGATTLIHRLGRPLRMLKKKYPETEIQVTVGSTEEIVAGLLARQFDLGLISLPVVQPELNVVPLFEEELLVLKPSASRVSGSKVGQVSPEELVGVPFLLYPTGSNMRGIIDDFFARAGIAPHVVMEAEDTEAIKSLVESGFGYSILPAFALRGGSNLYQTLRVRKHKLVRRQALATVKTEYPRALTESIAEFLRSALATTITSKVDE